MVISSSHVSLVDLCISLDLAEAAGQAVEQAFLSVKLLAETTNDTILAMAPSIGGGVVAPVLFAVRDACRKVTSQQSCLSNGDTQLKPTDALAPEKEKPTQKASKKHKKKQEVNEQTQPEELDVQQQQRVFPKTIWVNQNGALLGTGQGLLHQEVKYALDEASGHAVDGQVPFEFMKESIWYLLHFHGKRHSWNLADDQSLQLLRAAKEYLMQHATKNCSLTDDCTNQLVVHIKYISSELRNRGTGAKWYYLPPTLHQDKQFIQESMPPKFGTAYAEGEQKKKNTRSQKVYRYVLGRIEQQEQADKKEEQQEQDEAAEQDTAQATQAAVSGSAVLQVLIQNKTTGVAVNATAQGVCGSLLLPTPSAKKAKQATTVPTPKSVSKTKKRTRETVATHGESEDEDTSTSTDEDEGTEEEVPGVPDVHCPLLFPVMCLTKCARAMTCELISSVSKQRAKKPKAAPPAPAPLTIEPGKSHLVDLPTHSYLIHACTKQVSASYVM